MGKIREMIKRDIKRTSVFTIVFRAVLVIAVLIVLVNQIIIASWFGILMCALALMMYLFPSVLALKFKIRMSAVLECGFYLGVFGAMIMGETWRLYGKIPLLDSILHTLSGFACAGLGFSLVMALSNSQKMRASAFVTVLIAFCVSMTVGVLWECAEYASDSLLRTDAQKDFVVQDVATLYLYHGSDEERLIKIEDIDHTEVFTKNGEVTKIENGYLDIGLIDTMKDLLVNLAGAVVFCVLGFIQLKTKVKLVDYFVLIKDSSI